MIRSTWNILHFLGMFGYFLMSIPTQLTFYLNAQHTAKNRSGWQKTGFGISCKLSQPAFVWNVTVCFLGQIKQNIINLSSAESAHRVVKVCKSILIICIIGQTGILSGQQRSDFDLSRLLVGLFFHILLTRHFCVKELNFNYVANSTEPDQKVSSEAFWSKSTLFSQAYSWVFVSEFYGIYGN